MSMLALMTAVRNYIRTGTTADDCYVYADKDCDLSPSNGQPPPSMGQFYVAVHEGNIAPEVSYSTFEEVYSVSVTVTIRMSATPWDRSAQMKLYGDDGSLDKRARQIAALIHMDTRDHRVINAANLLDALKPPAEGYAKQGFVEPLRFAGLDVAVHRGPDWFHANIETMGNNPPMGWSKTIRFTGARRVQETLFAEGIGEVS